MEQVHFDSSVGPKEKVPFKGSSSIAKNQTPGSQGLLVPGKWVKVSSSSPNLRSLVPSSSPKWEGTHGGLNIQWGVKEHDELRENDQPLSWKLKKQAIVEEEVHPENVLDPEGGECEKDVDDDVSLGVTLQCEKWNLKLPLVEGNRKLGPS
ncbi:hypothetical protein HAX54_026673, partial [Datura stramonium]|nr:hypothetical protein [Datura stramonium]